MKFDALLRLCNDTAFFMNFTFFILWEIYCNLKEMNILAEMCVLGLQGIY